MNQKEISEIRRRFRPDKNNISRIYGCYVNGSKEIVSYLDEPFSTMPQEETEKYLNILKKSLSGVMGRNLIDIVFSTEQVQDSEEHRMLSALRDSALKDTEVRQRFYQRVIECIEMEENYLLLLAHDAYDVPHRSKDGMTQVDASDEVFSYIVCCICPVKDGKIELGYFPGDNEFHNCAAGQVVAAPELGFMFPAFDDRASNIYNALFYSRSAEAIHQEFIDGIFNVEAPMSAVEQKETFQTVLSDALEENCSFDIVQSVHERLRETIEQHREAKNPEPLEMTAGDIGAILADCGVADERVAAFRAKCGEQFGDGAALSPENLIDSKRFEVSTSDAKVSVDPERSYLVETRIIDGRKYLLIPADESVEVNGMAVGIRKA